MGDRVWGGLGWSVVCVCVIGPSLMGFFCSPFFFSPPSPRHNAARTTDHLLPDEPAHHAAPRLLHAARGVHVQRPRAHRRGRGALAQGCVRIGVVVRKGCIGMTTGYVSPPHHPHKNKPCTKRTALYRGEVRGPLGHVHRQRAGAAPRDAQRVDLHHEARAADGAVRFFFGCFGGGLALRFRGVVFGRCRLTPCHSTHTLTRTTQQEDQVRALRGVAVPAGDRGGGLRRPLLRRGAYHRSGAWYTHTNPPSIHMHPHAGPSDTPDTHTPIRSRRTSPTSTRPGSRTSSATATRAGKATWTSFPASSRSSSVRFLGLYLAAGGFRVRWWWDLV